MEFWCSDPTMKPIPRPSIEKIHASCKEDRGETSDPGQYMVKSYNGKTVVSAFSTEHQPSFITSLLVSIENSKLTY